MPVWPLTMIIYPLLKLFCVKPICMYLGKEDGLYRILLSGND